MTGKRIGYIRVSTDEQNPDRQIQGIDLDKKYIEYASAKSTNRPQLQIMLDFLREDDILIVHSMDRLARNLRDLLKIVDNLVSRKVTVKFIKENLIFDGNENPMAKFQLQIMGAMAELEYAINRERQREGIAEAKKQKKYKGSKKKLDAAGIEKLKIEMLTREPKRQIARNLGISHCTLYKYLRELRIK